MKLRFAFLFSMAVLMSCVMPGHSDVKIGPLFTDNMVLQREKPIHIWGAASAGERVKVSVGSQTKSTFAKADGTWQVTLAPMPASENVHFQVAGNNTLELKNVAIGDVYICAGQSNMEWPVIQSNNATSEIAAANYPQIRFFTVPKKVAGMPQKIFGAPVRWEVCSPQTVGDFSAVAYYFGRELNQKLKVPIGLINSSWGGVVCQAFVSKNTLLKRDDFHQETLQMEAAFSDSAISTMKENIEDWWNTNDLGTRENWNSPAFNDAAWSSFSVLPTTQKDVLIPFNGVMWVRRSVEIPASWQGKDLTLNLGPINDHDTTYFNGQLVGKMYMWNQPRIYKIPGSIVKSGRAVIAVRFLDNGAANSFGGRQAPYLELTKNPAQKIEFGSDWKFLAGEQLKDLPTPPVDVRGNPNQPAVLFNGMIAPLIPFGVRGVVWYQGESNVGNAAQYRTLFPQLIDDWRQAWNAKQDGSEFGFYFAQISTFGAHSDQPVAQSNWAELREAQTAALDLPRTAMTVTIDTGISGYHSPDKQDVGHRLALDALHVEYGQKEEYSGPVFQAMKIEGDKIRVEFSHAEGLKTTTGQMPIGFEIAGANKKWVIADAKVEGQNVVVSNPQIASPLAVRYAWQDHPLVNLVNGAELPAAPFGNIKSTFVNILLKPM